MYEFNNMYRVWARVSKNADTCPSCGNPLIAIDGIFNEGAPVTIQKTFKKWKLVKVFAWILIFTGVVSLPNGDLGVAVGGFAISIGVILLIVAKLGSWWSTG